MRIPALPSVTVSVLVAALVTNCTHAIAPTISKTEAPTVSPAAAPTVLQKAVPTISQANSVVLKPDVADVQAEFNGYAYSYKKDGAKTDAMFVKKFLPPDDKVVIAVIRDIIARSYGDKVDSPPRLEGSGAEQTIRIDGKTHAYIVVPIKENTGEIHSLIITRLTH